MQIFKRLKINVPFTHSSSLTHSAAPTKPHASFLSGFFCSIMGEGSEAQNLIEFIFVFPILIFLTLVMFEVALFWQDVNSIYNLNAEINANAAIQNYSGLKMKTRCPAATKAIEILKKRDAMISLVETNYNDADAINDSDLIVDGSEPFALYKFYGGPTITASNGEVSHQIQLWVDCRNPFEDGVTTQIEFYHKTLIMKATIPRFDSPQGIVVIPENIFISSPKLNTIRHY